MDVAYIVKIKVNTTIYDDYKSWLQAHIEGNAAIGVKGMMEVIHEGKVLFPSVEIYTTDPIDEFHLITVKYYIDSRKTFEDYLEHYAPSMRGEVPEEFVSKTTFNRFIDEGIRLTPLGEIDEHMEALYQKHSEDIYNFASFEVFG